MSCHLSETAEADIDAILDFIAENDGANRALHVFDKFVSHFEKLASNPGIGSLKRELTGDDVRWWPVFRFLILYSTESEGITILRVVHGNRNLDRLMADGPTPDAGD